MKMETYKTAEELGTTERLRAAIIDAMLHLSTESYPRFDMMNVSCCAVACVKQQYKPTSVFEKEWGTWNDSCEVVAIFGGGFLSGDNILRKMRDVTQRDAAWVWRHYLTTGKCATPDEFANRLAVLAL